jgi:hypothetical protein
MTISEFEDFLDATKRKRSTPLSIKPVPNLEIHRLPTLRGVG